MIRLSAYQKHLHEPIVAMYHICICFLSQGRTAMPTGMSLNQSITHLLTVTWTSFQYKFKGMVTVLWSSQAEIGLDHDLWLLLKIMLDSCPIYSKFCKITFTQLSVKVSFVVYTVQNRCLTFDLPKSYLDFWLLLWPRTKIIVQDVLECHPLEVSLVCRLLLFSVFWVRGKKA